MREPSGENTGLSFNVLSRVNCTGSPFGSIFTYTSAGPKNVSDPRRNASIRPSGDNAGYTAESVKEVSCSHLPGSVRAGPLRRKYKNIPTLTSSPTPTVATTARTHVLFPLLLATAAAFPLSV